MPPQKSSFGSRFNQWMKQLSEEERSHFQKSENESVFCNVCGKAFKCGKRSLLDQHISTAIHSASTARSKGSRQLRVSDGIVVNTFNQDLCKAMLSADIPMEKLNNPLFKLFLEKYCNRTVPSPWILRNRNLKANYESVIESIRADLKDKFIWMGVDETTDKKGRFVANVIVGKLDGKETKPRLLISKELEKADSVTVTQLIMDALNFLWPGKLEAEKSKQFAVLLSDAAPYMVKTGKNLKKTYPKLLHITCLAHGLHRVAETVRSSYGNVDKLLGNIKAIFKKSPYRVRQYNALLPGINLPPEPVITRWGTWLEAAVFIAENFVGIKQVVESFDTNDAECIRKAQDLFQKPGIQEQLADILSNYAFLGRAIQKLEGRNLSTIDATTVLTEARATLSSNNSAIGEKIKLKLENVLKKNPNIQAMIQLAEVLKGNSEITTGMEPALIAALKFCPLTSVELERGFSMEKAILTDRRCNFTMENLEMHVVCHFEFSIIGDNVVPDQ